MYTRGVPLSVSFLHQQPCFTPYLWWAAATYDCPLTQASADNASRSGASGARWWATPGTSA